MPVQLHTAIWKQYKGSETVHNVVLAGRANVYSNAACYHRFSMATTGIYIHIPFCRSRCSYCDFATGLFEADLAARYVQALADEIQRGSLSSSIDTIYFGGGTPSLLNPAQLEKLLNAVSNKFSVEDDVEVTMEMNPGTVTPDVLRDFRSLGVNRASFGAQTFDDDELARLGRSHDAAQILTTYSDLRSAGFDNISFDLIAGLPGQCLDRWQHNVERALSLRPEHLSFYLLEVHEGTPLAEHIRRGIQPKPDEDLTAVMYAQMLERAEAAGYQHYEISNLCLPGFPSRHNTKYWTGAPYFGFGCSAHSYDGRKRRWANERDINRYVQAIESRTSPVVEEQLLSAAEIRSEAVFLGMRMMRGVDAKRYQDLFGIDLYAAHDSDLARFIDAGLVEIDGDLVRLTRAGALMSNEVFAAFV
jgi:oxygen-independent coproporphyrinogen III oxidase